jgi:hypothetical protein
LIERHAKLSRSIAEIEGQIATARAALAIALLELRRHELAWVVRGGRAAAERRAARRFGIASRRR